ncbi:MAG TPA: ATP-binding protein [archaeon]|nr:ATP-binding protein [archaeon]HRT03852.1 ATP-binding protein [Candidatus Diapherotrites archaeon]
MYKIVDIDGEEFAIPDDEFYCLQNKKYQLLLQKANIPSFYWDINFVDYQGDKTSKEFQIIYNYAHNFFKPEFNHINLYLCGGTSTQKSALMYNIGKTAIKLGYNVKSILAGSLIDKLMKIQGFNYNEKIYNEIQDLKQSDLLLIDDFGDIKKTLMWQNEESKNIILVEWDKFLRDIVVSNTHVVMTSNYNLALVKQYFGEYIYELLDRNFFEIYLQYSVKEKRKNKIENAIRSLIIENSSSQEQVLIKRRQPKDI